MGIANHVSMYALAHRGTHYSHVKMLQNALLDKE